MPTCTKQKLRKLAYIFDQVPLFPIIFYPCTKIYIMHVYGPMPNHSEYKFRPGTTILYYFLPVYQGFHIVCVLKKTWCQDVHSCKFVQSDSTNSTLPYITRYSIQGSWVRASVPATCRYRQVAVTVGEMPDAVDTIVCAPDDG